MFGRARGLAEEEWDHDMLEVIETTSRDFAKYLESRPDGWGTPATRNAERAAGQARGDPGRPRDGAEASRARRGGASTFPGPRRRRAR